MKKERFVFYVIMICIFMMIFFAAIQYLSAMIVSGLIAISAAIWLK